MYIVYMHALKTFYLCDNTCSDMLTHGLGSNRQQWAQQKWDGDKDGSIPVSWCFRS